MTLTAFLHFFFSFSFGRSIVEYPELHNYIPACHFWDQSEPRLFVCEAILETGLEAPEQKKNQTEGIVRSFCLSVTLLYRALSVQVIDHGSFVKDVGVGSIHHHLQK